MEINLYQYSLDQIDEETKKIKSDNGLIKSLAPLLIKIIQDQKKALVFCRDQELIKTIDASLWSYGKNRFIPHITIFDQGFDLIRQPILISNKNENSNKSDFLVIIDEADIDFVKSFNRAFLFFDSLQIEKVKKFISNNQKIFTQIKSYKKEAGKWQNFNIL
jgi:DNA polymerase IIIc chi subunit